MRFLLYYNFYDTNNLIIQVSFAHLIVFENLFKILMVTICLVSICGFDLSRFSIFPFFDCPGLTKGKYPKTISKMLNFYVTGF